MNFLTNLFSSDGFMPHGHCYLWNPPLVWLHVISDSLIALAYLTIPVTLIYIARKRKDLPFDWIFACFGIFILACGATHALEIWTLWHPTYWLSGTMKALTAAASVATAILLVKLIPQLLAIPSPSILQQANRTLEIEIAERKRTEQALGQLQHRQNLIFNSITEGIHWLDTEDRIVFENPAAARMLGWEPSELLGRPSHSNTRQARTDGSISAQGEYPVNEGLRTGATYRAEDEVFWRKDGTSFPVAYTSSPVRDEKGVSIGSVVVFTDITERRRHEEKLQQQQAELRLLFDLMPVMIIFKDTKNRILRANRRLAETAGRPVEEIEGRPVLEVFPQDAARFYEEDLEIIRSGEPKMGIVQLLRDLKGKEYWFQTDKVPVRDENGKVTGIIVVAQDITERKQASALLQVSQERLALATESAHIGIWDWDVVTNELVWDAQMYALYGIRQEDFSGAFDAWQKGLHSEDRERAEADIRVAIDSAHGFHIEFRVVWPSGEVRDIEAHAMVERAADGSTAHMVGVNWDITERKRVEHALRDSNEKFHQLADNITDVFWIRSPDMREVHYVSPAFERIWGIPVESLYANPNQWSDFILPEDRERVLKAFAALTGAAPSVDIEYRIQRPDGGIRWVRVRGFHVRDAAHKLIRHTGIVTDITERKQAEADLEKAHQELVAASHQAGMAEVATGVLHNVGNVLNSVNVSATLVMESMKKSASANVAQLAGLIEEHTADLAAFLAGDPRGKHLPAYLRQLSECLGQERQIVIQELDSLVKNIQHIKDIVAMQQSYGRTYGGRELLHVADLIEDGLRLNASALAGQDLEVIRDFQPVPRINADKHKILQILVNLIRNAKYACDESGRADKRMTFRVTNGDGRIKIAVSDNGVGIPPENLTRIFNHGFTTRQEGHGFGLHSGANAAREMGGSVTVQSDGLGCGATFTLELPAPPETA